MDSRRGRTEQTRRALMRAAEELIADKGLANVAKREIVARAGQKNESALQYHFGSLDDLIAAIHAERQAEVEAKRTELLQRTLAGRERPSLREICRLMVEPPFRLARSAGGFRDYIKAFGHEITLTDRSAMAAVHRKRGSTIPETANLLRAALAHLDDEAYERRVDGAVRFIAVAMVNHARQKNAFRGPFADIFLSSLIDALVGLLGAPESEETKSVRQSGRMRWRANVSSHR